MRLAAHIIDTAPLEAIRASLRGWLVEVLVWLSHVLAFTRAHAPGWADPAIAAAERELDAELRDAVRDLRRLLVVHAYARMPVSNEAAAKRTLRPLSVKRRAENNSFLRQATATALDHMHVGTLAERAERLRDALENLEPLIVETLAHMTRMHKSPRLPGVVIPLRNVVPLRAANDRAPARADTS
ncbi:MAG: hypothetical protein NW206_03085 [Hyphomonadaceae bacterium]|nr:hypothetical protein [Hyphomonadaceae bacterium]